MIRPFLALTALLGLTASTAADSWKPYGGVRAVDPTGRYYVVVTADLIGDDARYRWVERAADSEPVTALDGLPDEPAVGEEPVRPGDRVLAKGELHHAPMEVLVSSRGRGFVAIDQYGALGGGKTVQVVDATGEIRHALELAELFTEEEREGFLRTVSSIWWQRGAWLDDEPGELGELVLVSGTLLRVVDLETGNVRTGGEGELRRALLLRSSEARTLALELARELKLEGLDAHLRQWVGDAGLGMGLRLRAGLALAEAGDREVAAPLFLEAARKPRGEGVSEDDREFALEYLPAVLGDDAIPILREAMRGEGDEGWWPSIVAFGRMGERVVPVLLEMLAEPGQSADYNGGAAHALSQTGSKQALPGLLKAVEGPVEYVANAAINAAIKIGGDGIAPRLAGILGRGCTQDGRIATYFHKVKYPEALPALRKALERADPAEFVHGWLVEAIAFQEAP